jgi:HPP family
MAGPAHPVTSAGRGVFVPSRSRTTTWSPPLADLAAVGNDQLKLLPRSDPTVKGLISIALMAAAALVAGAAFIFPSLGPTAFLLFHTPLLPTAPPRNTIFEHFIGAAAGYLSLVTFGVTNQAPALGGVGWSRGGAAALSLDLTSGAMVWARVPHPPAGATTLIVSLGILREPCLDARRGAPRRSGVS